MAKVLKGEAMKVIADLKERGYSHEKLAVLLERTQQTIWAWSSPATNRTPCRSDYEALKRLTIE
jgi:hypothetical protein